jgi:hypothetical protein
MNRILKTDPCGIQAALAVVLLVACSVNLLALCALR